MKVSAEKSKSKAAFTIIELLTVMSIIVILISLMVPALSRARRYAKRVQQKNQFKAISEALEDFHGKEDPAGTTTSGFGSYPASDYDAPGATGTYGYCGAMKLAEALVGQDLLGFHPYSRFREDYKDGNGNLIYDRDPLIPGDDPDGYNKDLRRGPFMKLDQANAHRLWHIYGDAEIAGLFYREAFVLSDVFGRVQSNSPTGSAWIGMPILYYRAQGSRTSSHPHFLGYPQPGLGNFEGSVDSAENNYNYKDNNKLVLMGIPWKTGLAHLMASDESGGGFATGKANPLGTSSAKFFYHNTYNADIPIAAGRSQRPNSYILQSAGYDGEYGTSDDVFNFGN